MNIKKNQCKEDVYQCNIYSFIDYIVSYIRISKYS